MPLKALVGADIFDGNRRRSASALLLDGPRIAGIVPANDLPADAQVTRLDGGLLSAGFIDAQVNGGGGTLLNDDPTADGMARIAVAHRRFGTTALLPTLITDHTEATVRALAAAAEAVGSRPGVIGLHLEGPHLAPARKGAHVAGLMRPLGDEDVERLIEARARAGVIVLTVAVEQAAPARIRRLADAGIIVNLGHSDADYASAMAAIDAGARGITHLFNAMSPLSHRAPGLVGAALDAGSVWCGMITDGHHVDPAVLRVALRAKRGPGRCLIVTDAMPTVGVEGDVFELNGRPAYRRNGRLTLSDGTLAGADIDTASSLRFAFRELDLSLEEALRMLTVYPAEYLRIDAARGRLAPQLAADIAHLDDRLNVTATWIAGERQAAA